jgi:hypothetical protein
MAPTAAAAAGSETNTSKSQNFKSGVTHLVLLHCQTSIFLCRIVAFEFAFFLFPFLAAVQQT